MILFVFWAIFFSSIIYSMELPEIKDSESDAYDSTVTIDLPDTSSGKSSSDDDYRKSDLESGDIGRNVHLRKSQKEHVDEVKVVDAEPQSPRGKRFKDFRSDLENSGSSNEELKKVSHVFHALNYGHQRDEIVLLVQTLNELDPINANNYLLTYMKFHPELMKDPTLVEFLMSVAHSKKGEARPFIDKIIPTSIGLMGFHNDENKLERSSSIESDKSIGGTLRSAWRQRKKTLIATCGLLFVTLGTNLMTYLISRLDPSTDLSRCESDLAQCQARFCLTTASSNSSGISVWLNGTNQPFR